MTRFPSIPRYFKDYSGKIIILEDVALSNIGEREEVGVDQKGNVLIMTFVRNDSLTIDQGLEFWQPGHHFLLPIPYNPIYFNIEHYSLLVGIIGLA